MIQIRSRSSDLVWGWAMQSTVQHWERWNDAVNLWDKITWYVVFSVIAVLYWPRVWTQVLYAVLEWIFNYQNNGGRHGTGKMSTCTPCLQKILGMGKEGEGSSLKIKNKQKQATENPEDSGDKALIPENFESYKLRGWGSCMQLVHASLLWVGGIMLCTAEHLGCDD